MKRKSHLILTRGHNSPKWYFKTNFYVWKRVNGLKTKKPKIGDNFGYHRGRHEAKSTPRQNHVTYKACTVNLLPIVGPNPQSIIHKISVFSKTWLQLIKKHQNSCQKCPKIEFQKFIVWNEIVNPTLTWALVHKLFLSFG